MKFAWTILKVVLLGLFGVAMVIAELIGAFASGALRLLGEVEQDNLRQARRSTRRQLGMPDLDEDEL